MAVRTNLSEISNIAGVSVLAFFCVGISVFEENIVDISVFDTRCGDVKMHFFGRYFANLT